MNDEAKRILEELFAGYPKLKPVRADIAKAYNVLESCVLGGGKILVCGNGGSAADAEHIVGELMKGFMKKRPIGDADRAKLEPYLADHLQSAIPAISLVSQTALITAYANDVAPDMIYAQQVYAYARPGDVLIAISTSGNSPSIVNAAKIAKAVGAHTVALTARSGGALKRLCDATIAAPADATHAAQELHLPIYHALCAMLEATRYPD
jgi:D-sedoheptulose 7-phosphate isomerase